MFALLQLSSWCHVAVIVLYFGSVDWSAVCDDAISGHTHLFYAYAIYRN